MRSGILWEILPDELMPATVLGNVLQCLELPGVHLISIPQR